MPQEKKKLFCGARGVGGGGGGGELRRQFVVSCFNKHEIQIGLHQMWTTQGGGGEGEMGLLARGQLIKVWPVGRHLASSWPPPRQKHRGVYDKCLSSRKYHVSQPTICIIPPLPSNAIQHFLSFWG